MVKNTVAILRFVYQFGVVAGQVSGNGRAGDVFSLYFYLFLPTHVFAEI